jgi:hypothetical protein
VSILDQRTEVEPPAPAAAEAPARELAFVMEPQLQNEWCWAAVSTSVALYYAPQSGRTQCAVVNDGLEQTTCCQDGGSAACNQPYFLEKALAIVGHLASDFGGALDFDRVRAEIDAGRPFGLCIDWKGGGGHVVAVGGYDAQGEMLLVCDSMFGTSHVPLATFPASYQGGGTWSWTYLTQPEPR